MGVKQREEQTPQQKSIANAAIKRAQAAAAKLNKEREKEHDKAVANAAKLRAEAAAQEVFLAVAADRAKKINDELEEQTKQVNDAIEMARANAKLLGEKLFQDELDKTSKAFEASSKIADAQTRARAVEETLKVTAEIREKVDNQIRDMSRKASERNQELDEIEREEVRESDREKKRVRLQGEDLPPTPQKAVLQRSRRVREGAKKEFVPDTKIEETTFEEIVEESLRSGAGAGAGAGVASVDTKPKAEPLLPAVTKKERSTIKKKKEPAKKRVTFNKTKSEKMGLPVGDASVQQALADDARIQAEAYQSVLEDIERSEVQESDQPKKRVKGDVNPPRARGRPRGSKNKASIKVKPETTFADLVAQTGGLRVYTTPVKGEQQDPASVPLPTSPPASPVFGPSEPHPSRIPPPPSATRQTPPFNVPEDSAPDTVDIADVGGESMEMGEEDEDSSPDTVDITDVGGEPMEMGDDEEDDVGDDGGDAVSGISGPSTSEPSQESVVGGETGMEGADGRDDLLDPDEAKTLLREDFRWVQGDTRYASRESRGKIGYGTRAEVQNVEPFGVHVKDLPDESKGESVFKQRDERFEPFRGIHDIVREEVRQGMKPPKEEDIKTEAMKPFAKVGGQIIWIPYYERVARFYFTSEDYTELVSNVVESGGALKLKAPPQDDISKMQGTIDSVRQALSAYGLKKVQLSHGGMETRYGEWLELKQIMKALGKYQKTTTGEYNQAGLFSGNLREAVGTAIDEAVGKIGSKRKRQLGRGLEGSKRVKTSDRSDDEPASFQAYNPFQRTDRAPARVYETLPNFI